MVRVFLSVLAIAVITNGAAAEPVESFDTGNRGQFGRHQPQEPRRMPERLGVGAQLGGFFDPEDAALELRGWANRVGISLSWGRHVADPSDSGFIEVHSRAGKQMIGGVLFAFNNPEPGRSVPIRVYGTAGIVHTTQARGVWERSTPDSDGIVGEAGVEGSTGYWPFVGAGAEIRFARLGGLALGSELLFVVGGEGVGPGLRFAVRYYIW